MQSAAPLAAVIFDLDGTLVDSVPFSLTIINAMLAERRSPRRIGYAEALPFASSGGLALVEGLLAEDCRDGEADLAIFRARYVATATPHDSAYPGVMNMLDALRQAGLRLAICSNKPQHLCEKVLADLSLIHHFSVIVGSRPSLPAKPLPDMLDYTLELLGLAPVECLLVGDSEVDIALAATRAMHCLFVEHGYGNAHTDFPAHHRVADCAGLAAAILLRQSAQSGQTGGESQCPGGRLRE